MLTRKDLTAVTLAFVAISIFAAGLFADDRIELKLRLEEGKSYNIMAVTDQVITTGLEGQVNEVNQEVGFGYTFNVLKVEPNGDAHVKVKFHSIYMKHEGVDGNFEYDSTNPPEKVHPAAELLSVLVGLTFEMKMSPDGSVSEIKGTEEMIDSMFSKLKGEEDENESLKAQMIEDLKKSFGEGAMKESMSNIVGGWYPNRQVGLEESWTGEIGITKGMPMTMVYNNTLKFRHDGVAIIKTHTDIKMNTNADPIKMGPMTMQYELTGVVDGYLWMDEETGWTRGSEMTQEISGIIRMKGAPNMTEEGMEIPISVKGIVKTETFDIIPDVTD